MELFSSNYSFLSTFSFFEKKLEAKFGWNSRVEINFTMRTDLIASQGSQPSAS